MQFITLPGRFQRVKRLTGRFGGPGAERCWYHAYVNSSLGKDHRKVRISSRTNLTSSFEPEPQITATVVPLKPPKMIYACCNNGSVFVIFDDKTSRDIAACE